jgi:hypothetical protein
LFVFWFFAQASNWWIAIWSQRIVSMNSCHVQQIAVCIWNT